METTLIILKPDAVQRGLCGRIIGRFEDKGLQLVAARLLRVDRSLGEQLYAVHRDKPFFGGLLRFITASPVLVMALRVLGAVEICRKLMGATFGSQAEPGTIRGDFGVSNSFNLIHGSDSVESAQRELGLFFGPGDLLQYDRGVEPWIYDLSGPKPQ